MPRILFVTTDIGFGHKRVSDTLATAFKDTIPGCIIKTATYFDFFPPRLQRIVNAVYIYGLKWFPRVFGYIYLAQKRYKGAGVEFWSRFLGRRYARVIRNYSPSLIVITQGLACQWLGRLKRRGLITCPLSAVITDFTVHSFWIHPEIDLYIVATEDMKEELVSRGISNNRIAASGIPIDPKFSFAQGVKKNMTIVLVMGGGWGLGRMDHILTIIDKMDMPLELLVVTGRNRGLYRRLKEKRFNKPIRVYGLVDNISELMAQSSIIITKAGGVTVSELLASGLPAILWDIIPGQEEMNADYLVKAGIAIRINKISDIKDAIKEAMPLRYSRDLGKPNSTADAVSCLKLLITTQSNKYMKQDGRR